MNPDVYTAVSARAAGRCECCQQGFTMKTGRPTADHFFGRAKAEETIATVWLIGENHHRDKTDNNPSAVEWAEKFVIHLALCISRDWENRTPYFEAMDRAMSKRAVQIQKFTRG